MNYHPLARPWPGATLDELAGSFEAIGVKITVEAGIEEELRRSPLPFRVVRNRSIIPSATRALRERQVPKGR